MTQCQFANKFVLKYFSKLLNDFRIEQISFRDIILSEVDQTHIPLKLAAQASGVNQQPSVFSQADIFKMKQGN